VVIVVVVVAVALVHVFVSVQVGGGVAIIPPVLISPAEIESTRASVKTVEAASLLMVFMVCLLMS
jgi:hypothetical protein